MVNNADLMQLVLERLDRIQESGAANHAETVERLARVETEVQGLRSLPKRVDALEKTNTRLHGAVAAVSALISAALTFLHAHK